MSAPKETTMILKVDLACCRCYKKVKKLLCSFPQIQDQIYNEKQNTVTIKVVSCCPEKIRDKLRCKGGKSIKSIEIVEPKKPADKPPTQKPPPAEKPKEAPPAEKPKEAPPAAKPKEAPPAEKPKEPPPAKKPKEPTPAPTPAPAPAPAPAPKPAPEPKPAPPPKPAPAPPPPEPIPCRPVCCSDCYHGRSTGPCYSYGVPPPPPPPGGWCYDGCGSGWYGCRYRPGYCVSRCGDYICEENPTACVIM